MRYIRITNWNKFQHYKDRRPTWIKLLIEIIDEFDADGIPKKFYSLPDSAKLTFVLLGCLRAHYNNNLPYPDDKWLKNRLGINILNLQPLVNAGFIAIDTESVSKPYQSGNGLSQINTPEIYTTETETYTKETEKRQKVKKCFIPPTLEEIKSYIQANPKLSNIDPETFFKYFQDGEPPWTDSKGNPVKSWKQKIITWSNHNGQKPTKTIRRSLADDNINSAYGGEIETSNVSTMQEVKTPDVV